jgi:hypothetical protein
MLDRLTKAFEATKPLPGVFLYRPYAFDIRYHKDFPWDNPIRKPKKGGAGAFKVRKAKQDQTQRNGDGCRENGAIAKRKTDQGLFHTTADGSISDIRCNKRKLTPRHKGLIR